MATTTTSGATSGEGAAAAPATRKSQASRRLPRTRDSRWDVVRSPFTAFSNTDGVVTLGWTLGLSGEHPGSAAGFAVRRGRRLRRDPGRGGSAHRTKERTWVSAATTPARRHSAAGWSAPPHPAAPRLPRGSTWPLRPKRPGPHTRNELGKTPPTPPRGRRTHRTVPSAALGRLPSPVFSSPPSPSVLASRRRVSAGTTSLGCTRCSHSSHGRSITFGRRTHEGARP